MPATSPLPTPSPSRRSPWGVALLVALLGGGACAAGGCNKEEPPPPTGSAAPAAKKAAKDADEPALKKNDKEREESKDLTSPLPAGSAAASAAKPSDKEELPGAKGPAPSTPANPREGYGKGGKRKRSVGALTGDAPPPPKAKPKPKAAKKAPGGLASGNLGQLKADLTREEKATFFPPGFRATRTNGRRDGTCERACRALANMRQAASQICSTAGASSPECSDAQSRVHRATSRVRAHCGSCR